MDKRFIRKSGEIIETTISVNCVRGSDGSVVSMLGIVEEITARKNAEATRDRLAAIIESTTDLVGFTDPGGQMLYLNRAGRQLLGWGPDEDITDKSFMDSIPDSANHPTVTVGIPAAIRGGTWSGEITMLSRLGREFPVSQVLMCDFASDGNLEYMSTIIRDLTERKRLEGQLFQSQKLETVGRLAGGIAHEFNSILTAIIGRSEFLLGEVPAGSSSALHATEIRAAADRAAALTGRAAGLRSQQTLVPVSLDLNRTVAAMESLLHHLLGENVQVRLVLAEGLDTVRADAGQIEQVIVNLAINAREAMPAGGKLTIETSNVTFADESADARPDLEPGDYVMIAITDTGTGMSSDVKARIFDPFFSLKDVGSAPGLGLATSDGIIKQSGGLISVYSEVNVGSAFKIYLPRENRTTEIPPVSRELLDLPRGTESILLVEDDPALRGMAADLLRRLGYFVLAADNGVSALRRVEQHGKGPLICSSRTWSCRSSTVSIWPLEFASRIR